MNQEIIAPNKIDPVYMLKLSNLLLEIQQQINRLEHDRIDILGYGDHVLSDGELAKLLSAHICNPQHLFLGPSA